MTKSPHKPKHGEVINEIARTGRSTLLDELIARLPPDLPLLLRVPGLGPKSVRTLYLQLGIKSLKDLEEAAKSRRIEYIAITDHSRSLNIASGLSIEKLQKQHEEIRELNKLWDDFHIFTGVEMDILNEGVLDYPDECIKEMDVVIGSIHSGFKQSKEKLTQRMVKAIENLHVDIVAHPTGRLLTRREPYALNLESVFEAAKKTDTALEINANPNRLDIKAEYAREAKDAYGVKIAVNTDAHEIAELEHMLYGVTTARRGWLEKSSIINTMSLSELQRWLKRHD